MMISRKNINSLESLDREIHRLQSRATKLEGEMNEKFDYLQDNYSSMMIRSFLPLIGQKIGVAGSLLQLAFQNHRLQDAMSKLAQQIFNKVSDGVEFLSDKLDRNKKENGSEE